MLTDTTLIMFPWLFLRVSCSLKALVIPMGLRYSHPHALLQANHSGLSAQAFLLEANSLELKAHPHPRADTPADIPPMYMLEDFLRSV